MLRLRPKFLSIIALSAILALLSTPALAADPECVDAVGEPATYTGCQLKTGGLVAQFNFCSPQNDIDGDPIPEVGAIASCSVSLDGQIQAVATVDRPGQFFSINLTSKNPGHRIAAWCTTAEGLDGEVWTSDVCFPAKQPKKPHKQ